MFFILYYLLCVKEFGLGSVILCLKDFVIFNISVMLYLIVLIQLVLYYVKKLMLLCYIMF